MEQLDEHEMMVEYSEMTSFDFNSEEFRKVRQDYMECKDFLSRLAGFISRFTAGFKPVSG